MFEREIINGDLSELLTTEGKISDAYLKSIKGPIELTCIVGKAKQLDPLESETISGLYYDDKRVANCMAYVQDDYELNEYHLTDDGKAYEIMMYNVHQGEDFVCKYMKVHCNLEIKRMLDNVDACKIRCDVYRARYTMFLVTGVTICEFNNFPPLGFKNKGIKTPVKLKKALLHLMDDYKPLTYKMFENNVKSRPVYRDGCMKFNEYECIDMYKSYIDLRRSRVDDICVKNGLPKTFLKDLIDTIAHAQLSIPILNPDDLGFSLHTPLSLTLSNMIVTVALYSYYINGEMGVSFKYIIQCSLPLIDEIVLEALRSSIDNDFLFGKSMAAYRLHSNKLRDYLFDNNIRDDVLKKEFSTLSRFEF